MEPVLAFAPVAFVGGRHNDCLRAKLDQSVRHAAVTQVIADAKTDSAPRRVPQFLLFGGESIGEVFRSVGGQIRESWCGPCFGQGPDALARGERAITSFNRNWQNRMGVGGEGYLASPPVVAASALLGYMAPPSELGLAWEPERFEV